MTGLGVNASGIQLLCELVVIVGYETVSRLDFGLHPGADVTGLDALAPDDDRNPRVPQEMCDHLSVAVLSRDDRMEFFQGADDESTRSLTLS